MRYTREIINFISGHVLLADATGAEVHLSENVKGDEIDLGDVLIKVLETPGHTPEHVSYLLYEKTYS